MKNEKEGLRFTHLDIENFKNIDKKVVDIDGRSLLISGKNGVGKSSFIQALLSGIDSKQLPTNTTKKGETKAVIKTKIAGILNGQEEEYEIHMYFTSKDQKGRLVLYNSKQEKVNKPKAVLDSIVGNLGFDIFKFLKDNKKNQIKILKELSGVTKDIDLLDIERKKVYDDRTFLTRKVEESEAIMNTHGFTQDQIDLYSTPIPVEPINNELEEIGKSITQWNDINTKTKSFKESFEINIPASISSIQIDTNTKKEKIEALKIQIQLLEGEIAINDTKISTWETTQLEHRGKYEKGKIWLDGHPEPSAKEISTRLSDATTHNNNCEKISQLAEKQKLLFADKNKLQKLNDDIVSIDDKKINLIKKSKLPIQGVTFTEDDIFLDGIPLEEGQINTQKLIDVGFDIAMALNPNLKCVFLHEGSLFDQTSLDALIKKCEDKGYQLIAELVSEDKDLSITFTENEG